MPLDKQGKYRISPQVASMHDAHPMKPKGDIEPAKPDPGEQQSSKGHVEIHLHDDGSAHTVHHHPDGKQEEKQHGSHHEAHEAVNEHFQDDGCAPTGEPDDYGDTSLDGEGAEPEY